MRISIEMIIDYIQEVHYERIEQHTILHLRN